MIETATKDLGSQFDRTINRRDLLAASAAILTIPSLSFAQDFSSKPIRIVVGATPGGSIDFGARTLAGPLGEILKTQVIVENKPGASGMIATEYVSKSPADGHTLVLGTPSPIIIAPQVLPRIKFNPLTELAAINTISTSPIALAVNPNLGIKNLKELVTLSKTRPIKMALPLAGSASHLVVELVAKATGCDFLNIPYKGGAPAMTDTIAGHTDATVSDLGVFVNMHKEGRLRIIAVTSEKRLDGLPDVQTVSETAPGFVATNWLGVFAPANTPAAIVQRISAAMVQASARDDVKKAFASAFAITSTLAGPEQFQKFVAAEYQRFGAIVRERNIVVE